MQIVSMTGLRYPAVRACIDLFDARGWPAIRPALRGRIPSVGLTHTQAQQDNRGKTRRMINDDALDAEKLFEFSTALVKDAGKKVLLILDNLRVYHRKVVKDWEAERSAQIEQFDRPSY